MSVQLLGLPTHLLSVSRGFVWSTYSFLVHVETGLLCSDPIPVSLLTVGLLPGAICLPPPRRMHLLSLQVSTICMLLPRTSGNSMGPAREKILRSWWSSSICSFPNHLWVISAVFQTASHQPDKNTSSFVLHSQNWSRFSWITMGHGQAKTSDWSQLNFCSLGRAFLGFSSTSAEFPAANTLSLLASAMMVGWKMAEENIYLVKKKKT